MNWERRGKLGVKGCELEEKGGSRQWRVNE